MKRINVPVALVIAANFREVRPRGHFLTARHQGWCRAVFIRHFQSKRPSLDIQVIEMRRLEEYEEIGLIGYPSDGEYIAVLGGRECQNWLLGGELCGLNGAVLADQAAALPRYYPQESRLVVVTIKDNWIVALKDYDAAEVATTDDHEERFACREQ